MKTIRRNAHKKIGRILDVAHSLKVYALENGFVGEDLDDGKIEDIVRKRLAWPYRPATLQSWDGGKYVLHVHANLWYEFRSVS